MIGTGRGSVRLALAAGLALFAGATVLAQSPATVTTLIRSTPGSVDGTGAVARFLSPSRLAIDPAGNLLISDGGARAIRRMTPAGVVTTLAGLDQGVMSVSSLGAGPTGHVYFTSILGAGARHLSPDGSIESVSSTPAVGSLISVVTVGPSGDLFLGDFSGIWKIGNGQATRIAGGGTQSGFTVADGPIGVATFVAIDSMTVDPSGTIYLTEQLNVVRKVAPDGNVTTIAGAFNTPGSADGVGTAARFNHPAGIAVDSAGNLWIADTGNHMIRRMAPDGTVTTVAGTAGVAGFADGPSAAALFKDPSGLVIDAAGAVFVADRGNAVVRRIAGGVVSTFAGLPAVSTTGTQLDLGAPKGVAIDARAKTYVSDAASHVIRTLTRVNGSPGIAGGKAGEPGSADGPAAITARFTSTVDVAFDGAGNTYVLENKGAASGSAIRRIAPDGMTTTFAGSLISSGTADGTGGQARSKIPQAMVTDAAGNIFVAESCTIRKVTPSAVVTTYAGRADACGTTDGPSASATLTFMPDLAVDAGGTVYVLHQTAIRTVSPSGEIATLAGSATVSGTADGSGAAARFRALNAIAIDPTGTIYVADEFRIRRVTPGGDVTTLAGSTTTGSADGDGAAASFVFPQGLAIAGDGTIYVTDGGRIRTVTPSGTVTTVAGGASFFSVDGVGTAALFHALKAATLDPSGRLWVIDGSGGYAIRIFVPATRVVSTFLTSGTNIVEGINGAALAPARFNGPTGLALAADGSLFIADTGNHTIRRIRDNVASTIAGTAGSSGSADGTGAAARFSAPQAVAVDAAGTLYVADTGNNALRRILASGAVSTIAGPFVSPRGVAVDASGVVYVADSGNHVIRKISTSGSVTTFAGAEGVAGSADGTGAAARFSNPAGIVVAADGTIYVNDSGNHTLRAVSPSGAVTTIAGVAGMAGVTDGVGSGARLSGPEGLAIDPSGALYLADTLNGAVRVAVAGTPTAPTITSHPISRTVGVHEAVQFSCAATGSPSPAYSWEVLFSFGGSGAIQEGGGVSGADSPVLTITDPGASRNGTRYRCVATSTAGVARSSEATLTVNLLTVAPSRVSFGAVTAPGGGIARMTPPQTITVGWTGSGAPAWTVSSSLSWIHVTNGSGSGAGQFIVTVDPIAAAASGSITLTSPDEPEYSRTISVNFIAHTGDQPPVGVIDTPAAAATGLQGSLAVTGWALDDVELDRVELWRDPVAGETTPVFSGAGPGNGKIFIATTVRVAGARSDVEARYGFSYPDAFRAGWGYMLLTQGLWNQGNGTYTLYAFAVDKAGNASTIGTRTITVDNANATKPFGTIDTPSYGGTVSGMIQNFGWALTPGASCSIANPNVQVSIDSGALTPVVYGDVRSDIAGAFPAYTNAAAAGGHYTLDTTTLANGMHTIGWFVTDSCGRSDGIGSRFFTVANNASIATAAPATAAARASREWLLVRGTAAVDPPPAMADGTRVVRVGQAERIELQLPGDTPYAVAQGSLPIGASFDASEGRFYWQPAAGFLGAYDLAFTAGTRTERLRVVVGPPVRMVIDTPQPGNVLSWAGFTVAGWAVDLASVEGAGIDALHVWAYPVGGGAPVFVGAAAARGARPDVARLYGQSFVDAGFTVKGTLPPGTYDLVGFAHSAAANTFAGAETVRIIVR